MPIRPLGLRGLDLLSETAGKLHVRRHRIAALQAIAVLCLSSAFRPALMKFIGTDCLSRRRLDLLKSRRGALWQRLECWRPLVDFGIECTLPAATTASEGL